MPPLASPNDNGDIDLRLSVVAAIELADVVCDEAIILDFRLDGIDLGKLSAVAVEVLVVVVIIRGFECEPFAPEPDELVITILFVVVPLPFPTLPFPEPFNEDIIVTIGKFGCDTTLCFKPPAIPVIAVVDGSCCCCCWFNIKLYMPEILVFATGDVMLFCMFFTILAVFRGKFCKLILAVVILILSLRPNLMPDVG